MNTTTQQTNTATATVAMPTAWIYLTVNQFNAKHPAFPVGTLRHQIFHASENGLKKSGAIIRNGRRVLIREDLYFSWLEAQQGDSHGA